MATSEPGGLTPLPSLASLPDDYLLTPHEVSRYLRVDYATVESWRRAQFTHLEGPAYVRLGNGKRSPIRYRADVIRAWLAANTHDPNGGQTPARCA